MDKSITLIQFFKLGGWAMWPLLIFSIATISLILERLIYILIHNLKVDDIAASVLQKLRENDIEGAKEICKKSKKNKIASIILLRGLEMSHLGEHRMENIIATEAAKKINDLERGFNFLIALGSLSPITGFLGTVSGMITAFRDIANAADVNAQLVANGIFEALITTAYGLIIAIVAIAGYNIFSHIVDNFTKDIELAGSEIVTAIISQEKK
ncbi:MAG TPA: MotA/TolQ/ExbB proton channel family protein [Spirochaetota bacterium]|nr:MotA/TolQ/ExbB proton channel family protein [Spirochaetota bacterium]HOL56840.1 MotA/TolQ/ExbB proton channel family protein [Spirochaetota bacterium]HPP04401.1 MotA/TolQ/ExbB proton channel family protein [Spirochaetota bacterium]